MAVQDTLFAIHGRSASAPASEGPGQPYPISTLSPPLVIFSNLFSARIEITSRIYIRFLVFAVAWCSNGLSGQGCLG